MKEIPLTKGQVTFVDDDNYETLMMFSWWSHWSENAQTYYAARTVDKNTVFMHDVIMNVALGLEVDHRDYNGLNNQKNNLRVGTRSQNHANARKQANTSSRFKGVSESYKGKPWQVGIKINYKAINLGSFNLEEDAARAYDRAAIEYFKEYARLNFPDEHVAILSIPAALREGSNDGRYHRYVWE